MYSASDLKNGVIFIYNSEPYKVLDYKHTHMGRGGANISLKVRGLISGNVIPLGLKPSDNFEAADLVKKEMQFLYREEDTLFFMDPISYEQVEIEAQKMDEDIEFMQDGESYPVLFWGDMALSIEIPPKVTVEVLECDPGVKGNSAANMYKSAMVTGKIRVKVPLFIEQGEKIKVDTINKKYVERAK